MRRIPASARRSPACFVARPASSSRLLARSDGASYSGARLRKADARTGPTTSVPGFAGRPGPAREELVAVERPARLEHEPDREPVLRRDGERGRGPGEELVRDAHARQDVERARQEMAARRHDARSAGELAHDEAGFAGGDGLEAALGPARAGPDGEDERRAEKDGAHGNALQPAEGNLGKREGRLRRVRRIGRVGRALEDVAHVVSFAAGTPLGRRNPRRVPTNERAPARPSCAEPYSYSQKSSPKRIMRLLRNAGVSRRAGRHAS